MQEKKNMRQILLDMTPGEVQSFPAEKSHSVTSTASLVSFQFGRKYSTKRNRENNTLEVTREE